MQDPLLTSSPSRPISGIRIWLPAFALAVLATCFGGSLLVGDVTIDPTTAWNALFHHDSQIMNHVIVRDWRLPRAVADVLVGASLAVAGAIMQSITRNPLASPGIMGLNTGASFVAVIALVIWPASSRAELMTLSILGAAGGAMLVFGLGHLSRGGVTPVRLALTGVAVSSLLGAIGNGVTIYYELGQDVLLWSARGTDTVQWADVMTFLPLAMVGLAGAAALSPSLGVLSLGDYVASSLGQRAKRTRFLASAVVVALAGGAVSLAGPVGFVGLMVPHLVRGVVGMDPRLVIPGSALGGSMLMIAADVGARAATTPFRMSIPVGVVTSLLGVPFFLYLVCRKQHGRRGGRT
jgi:iron complex transport system permease protein